MYLKKFDVETRQTFLFSCHPSRPVLSTNLLCGPRRRRQSLNTHSQMTPSSHVSFVAHRFLSASLTCACSLPVTVRLVSTTSHAEHDAFLIGPDTISMSCFLRFCGAHQTQPHQCHHHQQTLHHLHTLGEPAPLTRQETRAWILRLCASCCWCCCIGLGARRLTPPCHAMPTQVRLVCLCPTLTLLAHRRVLRLPLQAQSAHCPDTSALVSATAGGQASGSKLRTPVCSGPRRRDSVGSVAADVMSL